MMKRAAFALFVIMVSTAPAQVTWIQNVRLHQPDGKVSDPTNLTLKNGIISKIGSQERPGDTDEILDGTGLVAYPGFIDGWSELGLTEVDSVRATIDTSEIGRFNLHLRAGIAVNPHSSHIPVARVNGITSALVVPRGGLLSGRADLLNLLGRTVPSMTQKAPPIAVIQLPRTGRRELTAKGGKKWEENLDKSWKELETHLNEARRLLELQKKGIHPDLRERPGQERLSLMATAEHLRKDGRWLIRAESADTIRAALRFGKKHNLKLILAGLKEAWKVADELKESGHGLLLGSPWSRPAQTDPYDSVFSNAAVLHRKGLKFGFCSQSASNVRNLPYQAATCVAYGLPREAALRALTLGTAEALGASDQVGTLEVGKRANLALFAGDPLDATVNPIDVIINGSRVPLVSRHTLLADPFISQ